MKNLKQTGILLVLLVLPVFVFAFLKIFASNEFAPPEPIVPERAADCPILIGGEYRVPSFKLQDQAGKTIVQSDLQGKVYVAAFIDAQCATKPCAIVNTALSRVQERFADGKRVSILAHTANPLQDSVDVRLAFANRYRANPEQWYFVSASQPVLTDLARCGYGLLSTAELTYSPKAALVDAESRIRGIYDLSNREEVNQLLDEASLLLAYPEK